MSSNLAGDRVFLPRFFHHLSKLIFPQHISACEDGPFRFMVGRNCCGEPVYEVTCETVCENDRAPRCWNVSISGTGLSVDGVSIDGSYIVEEDFAQRPSYGSHCRWTYVRFCEGDSPSGCIVLNLILSVDKITLYIYCMNHAIWDGWSGSGAGCSSIAEFELEIEPPINCLGGNFELARVGGGGGTATISANDGPCDGQFCDYFIDLCQTCNWWEEDCLEWPPFLIGFNETCGIHSVYGYPYGCVPGSMTVTISNIDVTDEGCEDTIAGEYEVPLKYYSSYWNGEVYALGWHYGYRDEFCGGVFDIKIFLDEIGGSYACPSTISNQIRIVSFGGDAEGSEEMHGSLPPINAYSWALMNFTLKGSAYWACTDPCMEPSVTGEGSIRLIGDYRRYDLTSDCATTVVVEGGEICTIPDQYYTPPTPQECEACENNEAACCWRATISGSGTTLPAGYSVNDIDIQLAQTDEDECLWKVYAYCVGVPGDCFYASMKIDGSGDTVTITLTLHGVVTTPGGGFVTHVEFEEEFEAPINCLTGEFELPEVGGTGTATVKAYDLIKCYPPEDIIGGCVRERGGENEYHGGDGCQPYSMTATLSNFELTDTCGGGNGDGEYELWMTSDPCVYMWVGEWVNGYTGVFTLTIADPDHSGYDTLDISVNCPEDTLDQILFDTYARSGGTDWQRTMNFSGSISSALDCYFPPNCVDWDTSIGYVEIEPGGVCQT
jgi:hypothetical protein